MTQNKKEFDALDLAIVSKKMQGKSNISIAKELKKGLSTIKRMWAKITKEAWFQEQGETLISMIPQAIQVYKYHLDQKDKGVAQDILRGLGFLVPRERREHLIREDKFSFSDEEREKIKEIAESIVLEETKEEGGSINEH